MAMRFCVESMQLQEADSVLVGKKSCSCTCSCAALGRIVHRVCVPIDCFVNKSDI